MFRFVVNVHEGSFDIRECFDLVLKLLRDVVSFPEGRLGGHDHVDLDEVVWSALQSLQSAFKYLSEQ